MENLNKKFMNEIGNITDPVVFLGVAKVLKVKIFEDGAEATIEDLKNRIPRDFTDIFADVMFAYDKAGRKRKKELLKILREANKVKGDADGSGAEDTKKAIPN